MLGTHVEMLNNPAARRHAPTNQHEKLSDYGGLEVGRGQVMSSQRTHENRSRHDGHESSGASNPAPRRHVPANQHEQLSDYGGPEVGKGQVMSSQRTHENRSRHDGHESSEASSTISGGSRLGNFLRMSGWNAEGDGKLCSV